VGAQGQACSGAERPAAVALAAGPVADAAVAAAAARVYFAAAALLAWPLVASPAAGCDWAAPGLELAVRRVVDWAARFAARHWGGPHWVAAVARQALDVELEPGAQELQRRRALIAEWVERRPQQRACRD
jgi:hypothetical protein